jgi:hypothetical protein
MDNRGLKSPDSMLIVELLLGHKAAGYQRRVIWGDMGSASEYFPQKRPALPGFIFRGAKN